MAEPDHLADWWTVRARLPWSAGAHVAPVRGVRDGVLDLVRASRERDPARAARLEAALRAARADTDAGADLTFDVLERWQRLVLGVPRAGLRASPAFAKGDRERYGPVTQDEVARCLTDAADPAVPLPARAARAYLDVAFTHPFPDGNARAALLVLDAVLRRGGVVLDSAQPLVVVRRADDLDGARDLVRLVEVLVEATRRRAARRPRPAHR